MCQARPVYLSPHLDDAALSCGGLVHQQARSGLRPLVITCFAGVPSYHRLSPLAVEQHQRWGQPSAPVEQRRREDAAAMAHLGAEYEHWEYLDCIYRRHPGTGAFLYPGEAALFGEVRREDLGLIDELAARLADSWPAGEAALFAPLAAGHHVDHQILFRAAVGLRLSGFDVRFYEDYPYADDQQVLEAALQGWFVRPTPAVQPLTEEDLNAKIASVCCYRSQLEVLFGGETSVVSRVESYALGVGDREGYGERYWRGGTSQWLRNG